MAPAPSLESRFRETWQALGAPLGPCVVAVSGGPDSVALLRLIGLCLERTQIEVAHFDHGWRSDSSRDAAFVTGLAAELGIPCVCGHREQDQADGPVRPSEAAGRKARYLFLRKVAERRGARYLAVGHSADDQVETVLHRLVRGTGLRGLGGIPRFRALGPAVTIFRPLLSFRRHALIEYLRRIGQPYLCDPSNREQRYTRNRIRNDLLPRLTRDYNSQIVASLLRLSQTASAAQHEIGRLATEHLSRHDAQVEPGYASIPVDSWQGASEYLVREILALVWRRAGLPEQAMGSSHWRRLASMAVHADPVRAIFPAEVLVTREPSVLVMRSPAARCDIDNNLT